MFRTLWLAGEFCREVVILKNTSVKHESVQKRSILFLKNIL